MDENKNFNCNINECKTIKIRKFNILYTMIKGHQACSSISHSGRQYSASPYASSYMKYMQLMYDEDTNQATRCIAMVNELLLSF